MSKLIFKEEQNFRSSIFVWLITIPLFMVLTVIVVAGAANHKQNASGSALEEIIIPIVLLILVECGLLFLFLKSRLEVSIWSDGIRYRYPILINKEKFIPKDEIASTEVAKYNPIGEFGGWGWRTGIVSRKKAYNVSGNKGLRVSLKNGKQILFGTLKENELRSAVNRMMNPDNNKMM